MSKQRLSFADLEVIEMHCEAYILKLSTIDAGPNKHLYRCIGSILAALMIKVARKKIGIINPKGYLLRLNEAEQHAILHIRNELGWNSHQDNAIFRLLKINGI